MTVRAYGPIFYVMLIEGYIARWLVSPKPNSLRVVMRWLLAIYYLHFATVGASFVRPERHPQMPQGIGCLVAGQDVVEVLRSVDQRSKNLLYLQPRPLGIVLDRPAATLHER
jgi:hypothetical protein